MRFATDPFGRALFILSVDEVYSTCQVRGEYVLSSPCVHQCRLSLPLKRLLFWTAESQGVEASALWCRRWFQTDLVSHLDDNIRRDISATFEKLTDASYTECVPCVIFPPTEL
jgi:hypothetical protein